ncbi:hypothetical protein ACFL6L_02705 [candidate division KSB1 bacterium]
MTQNKQSGFTLDQISFELGMINCFVEMVACGVKRMAISPPIDPAHFGILQERSERIVQGFGIKSYLEKSLIVTDLQSDEFTRGKWAILYYKNDDVLKEYLKLKKQIEELEKSGKYKGTQRKDISRRFMRLLSYPDDVIEEKSDREKPVDPFILKD